MGSYGRCVSQRGHGKIVLGQERMVTWSNTEVLQSVRQAVATQRRGKEGLLEDRRATPSPPPGNPSFCLSLWPTLTL